MLQMITQDLQQIRAICQQLVNNERRNAQFLAQQQGMQGIAQTETFAAQQLQTCVALCNRIEQSMMQAMGMQQQPSVPFPNYQMGMQTGFPAGYQQQRY